MLNFTWKKAPKARLQRRAFREDLQEAQVKKVLSAVDQKLIVMVRQ